MLSFPAIHHIKDSSRSVCSWLSELDPVSKLFAIMLLTIGASFGLAPVMHGDIVWSYIVFLSVLNLRLLSTHCLSHDDLALDILHTLRSLLELKLGHFKRQTFRSTYRWFFRFHIDQVLRKKTSLTCSIHFRSAIALLTIVNVKLCPLAEVCPSLAFRSPPSLSL